MSHLPDCLYCRKDQRLTDLMIEVAPLGVSTLYLFKEQTHHGRCIVAYNGHVNELYELPEPELARFMQDVARAARAMKTAFNPAKINHGAYSDKLPHLAPASCSQIRGRPRLGEYLHHDARTQKIAQRTGLYGTRRGASEGTECLGGVGMIDLLLS